MLEVWKVLLSGSCIVDVVHKDNLDTGQVPRIVSMVSGPVLAKATVFSLGLDHVGAMFGPATLEVDRAAGVLLVVGGALEQVDDVGHAAGYLSKQNLFRMLTGCQKDKKTCQKTD